MGSSRAGWPWVPSCREGVSPASGPSRFFVLLVVVALFFCHGAFGYAHQLPAADALHDAHAAGDHRSGTDRGTDGVHPGDAYFATLLALLFGAFLLGGGRTAGAGLPVPAPSRGGCRVGGLPPPRGPTLPSLQVFRL